MFKSVKAKLRALTDDAPITRTTSGKISTDQIDSNQPSMKWDTCKCCGRSTNVGFLKNHIDKIFIILQTSGGLVATGVMVLLNYEFTAEGAFQYRETALIALWQMIPSASLVVALFSLQLMGLRDLWLSTVLSIIIVGVMILVVLWGSRLLMMLPSIQGVAS